MEQQPWRSNCDIRNSDGSCLLGGPCPNSKNVFACFSQKQKEAEAAKKITNSQLPHAQPSSFSSEETAPATEISEKPPDAPISNLLQNRSIEQSRELLAGLMKRPKKTMPTPS